MTKDELWKKYSAPMLQFMSKREFLAALSEYGQAVRERDAEIADKSAESVFNANPGRRKGTVSHVGGYAGHLLKDCAAAISREPLP